ncbi:hypothetical protein [Georgenia subflava]|uniref:Uncharacterized protein n=1 Tax=Georgenia subflava TaxID=1622177 RepID=A0A6N7EIN8_9MICO|nr:hypothetical protein [Georgenia subflava]MPV36036.1 hypothetical protein [Georgenia subflava]
MSQPSPTASGTTVLRAGAAVVADAGRLLAAHWPLLVLLAVVGVASRDLVLSTAVLVSRWSSVLSQMVLALAPFVQLLTVVGMLLVMRRRSATEHPVVALLVGTAAVMLPFLVIYQNDGNLAEDVITFGMATVEDIASMGFAPASTDSDVVTRLPAGTSAAVVLTVAVAFVARRVLVRLAVRTPPGHELRRSTLRLVAGYCEVVWLVLGAFVVTVVVDGASGWWSSRRVGAGLDAWWASVAAGWPGLGAFVEALLAGAGLLVAAALTAFLVPLAWLALAAIIYGVQAARVLRAGDLRATRAARPLVGRLGDARTDRALRLLTDPERQFGGVAGATVLVARAGWRPVLVFCLAFLVTDAADVLLTELVRVLVGPQSPVAWAALFPYLEAVGVVVVRVLTLALVASAVDSLLRDLGLPGGLRLGGTSRHGQGEEVRAEGVVAGTGGEELDLRRV